MGSFMSKHSAVARETKALLGNMPIDNKASALNYSGPGDKKKPAKDASMEEKRAYLDSKGIQTYPNKQAKDNALAGIFANTAQRENAKLKDPRAANRKFRANDPEGQSIERYDPSEPRSTSALNHNSFPVHKHPHSAIDPDAPGVPGTPGYEPKVKRSELDAKGKKIFDANKKKREKNQKSKL